MTFRRKGPFRVEQRHIPLIAAKRDASLALSTPAWMRSMRASRNDWDGFLYTTITINDGRVEVDLATVSLIVGAANPGSFEVNEHYAYGESLAIALNAALRGEYGSLSYAHEVEPIRIDSEEVVVLVTTCVSSVRVPERVAEGRSVVGGSPGEVWNAIVRGVVHSELDTA